MNVILPKNSLIPTITGKKIMGEKSTLCKQWHTIKNALCVIAVLALVPRIALSADNAWLGVSVYSQPTYILTSDLPGSITFAEPISPSTYNQTVSSSSYTTRAYETDNAFIGIRIFLTADHSNAGQAYMRRTGASTTCGVDADTNDNCIPFTVIYQPCHASNDPDGAPPEQELSTDSANENNHVIDRYAGEFACLIAMGGVPGSLRIRRDILPKLPNAGTFTGNVSLSVGAA